MDHYETVHTEENDGFTITLSITPETAAPDWYFESEEEEQHLLDQINDGDLMYFVAKVTASKNGIELGNDYLGGCCYESVEDFIVGGYFSDMVDTAIDEAKKAIHSLIEA